MWLINKLCVHYRQEFYWQIFKIKREKTLHPRKSMLNNIPLYKCNYKFLATHKQYDSKSTE